MRQARRTSHTQKHVYYTFIHSHAYTKPEDTSSRRLLTKKQQQPQVPGNVTKDQSPESLTSHPFKLNKQTHTRSPLDHPATSSPHSRRDSPFPVLSSHRHTHTHTTHTHTSRRQSFSLILHTHKTCTHEHTNSLSHVHTVFSLSTHCATHGEVISLPHRLQTPPSAP